MSALFDEVLGPGRFARSAYRVREAATKHPFGFNVFDNDILVASITLTAITVGREAGACLIGPLIVKQSHRGSRLGLELIEKAADLALSKDMVLMILVGDAAYYKKAGFEQVDHGEITMPGPVAPGRLLKRILKDDKKQKYQGLIEAV